MDLWLVLSHGNCVRRIITTGRFPFPVMKIMIETIPHDNQRYETVGDWVFLAPPYVAEGDLGISITVSELGDWRYNALIAVHELVEVLLCKQRGITQEAVDAFDKNFELNRPEGNEDEPGDAPDAPYRKEHFFATNIEALLSAELGVNWQEYEAKVNSL